MNWFFCVRLTSYQKCIRRIGKIWIQRISMGKMRIVKKFFAEKNNNNINNINNVFQYQKKTSITLSNKCRAKTQTLRFITVRIFPSGDLWICWTSGNKQDLLVGVFLSASRLPGLSQESNLQECVFPFPWFCSAFCNQIVVKFCRNEYHL